MLDCACLAGIVALRHFRKPEVEVEGDEVIVVSISAIVQEAFGFTQCTLAPTRNESTNTSRYTPYSDMFHLRALLVPIRRFNFECACQ